MVVAMEILDSSASLLVARLEGDFLSVSDGWKAWLELGRAIGKVGAKRALVMRGPGQRPNANQMAQLIWNMRDLGLAGVAIAFVPEDGRGIEEYAGMRNLVDVTTITLRAFATREEGMAFLDSLPPA